MRVRRGLLRVGPLFALGIPGDLGFVDRFPFSLLGLGLLPQRGVRGDGLRFDAFLRGGVNPEQLRPGQTSFEKIPPKIKAAADDRARPTDALARPARRPSKKFRSITENIGTDSAGGRFTYHIFGALAEFERSLIRERTNAGLRAARARQNPGNA